MSDNINYAGYISEIQLPNGDLYTLHDVSTRIYKATGSDELNPGIKNINCPDINQLEDGDLFFITFNNSNTYSGALQFKINNSTTAYNVSPAQPLHLLSDIPYIFYFKDGQFNFKDRLTHQVTTGSYPLVLGSSTITQYEFNLPETHTIDYSIEDHALSNDESLSLQIKTMINSSITIPSSVELTTTSISITAPSISINTNNAATAICIIAPNITITANNINNYAHAAVTINSADLDISANTITASSSYVTINAIQINQVADSFSCTMASTFDLSSSTLDIHSNTINCNGNINFQPDYDFNIYVNDIKGNTAPVTSVWRSLTFLSKTATTVNDEMKFGELYCRVPSTGNAGQLFLRVYQNIANSTLNSYFGISINNSTTPTRRTYSNCKIYGAVWNDYAEYRTGSVTAGGYCVTETPSGTMIKSTQRLQPGCKVTSDTFGFAIGENDQAQSPIAVSGRVLVYPYRSREAYTLGAAVCSAPNGTVDIMTREEIREYPERIIGTVSEIPQYEIWHGGEGKGDQNIEVDGRIWIYVK